MKFKFIFNSYGYSGFGIFKVNDSFDYRIVVIIFSVKFGVCFVFVIFMS